MHPDDTAREPRDAFQEHSRGPAVCWTGSPRLGWRSPSLGTTRGGGGTHGYVWPVLVRLGQSVEDELFVLAGVYFRDHRGWLFSFRLLRSPCGWTQKLVLRMSSVTQHEAPGRSSSGASLFQASAIPQVRKPLQAYSLMSGTASTNIVNRGSPFRLHSPGFAIQPTNVLKRC